MSFRYTLDPDDIDLVCNQTGCSRDKAEEVLLKYEGDLGKCIIILQST